LAFQVSLLRLPIGRYWSKHAPMPVGQASMLNICFFYLSFYLFSPRPSIAMEPLTLVALGVAAVVVALLVARRSVSPAPPQTGLLKPSIFKPTPEMKISVPALLSLPRFDQFQLSTVYNASPISTPIF
jgi:hypothetical protein